jgi:hypothetical protein
MAKPVVDTLHRAPSAGAVIKKVVEINPDLNTQEVIQILSQAVNTRGELAGEFAKAQIIDEAKALELARLSLKRPH